MSVEKSKPQLSDTMRRIGLDAKIEQQREILEHAECLRAEVSQSVKEVRECWKRRQQARGKPQ